MDEIPHWLPNLIFLEDYKGNWSAYIDAVHTSFHDDFVKTKPAFHSIPVFVRYHPAYEGKGATFWHIVSEGDQESERIPDMRRCERIRWPKSLIENVNYVNIWETIRPWKNQKQRRINLALSDFSYLVVIAERNKGFDLVTAYPLEKMARREKLRTEFEKAQRQKKEGSTL